MADTAFYDPNITQSDPTMNGAMSPTSYPAGLKLPGGAFGKLAQQFTPQQYQQVASQQQYDANSLNQDWANGGNPFSSLSDIAHGDEILWGGDPRLQQPAPGMGFPTASGGGIKDSGGITGATGTPQTGTSGQMPAGIDPRLWALYQKYGATPTGSGTGVTDWQYWQGKDLNDPYYLKRLGDDLAGNGMDPYNGHPGSAGGGSMGGSVGGFNPSTPTSQWSADPRTNELYGLLQGRATQSLNINANDPIIRNQTDAFNAAETRQGDKYINDLSERGGGNANLGLEKRMTSEKIGQDTAGFQSQLVGNELTARRQEISQALNQMGGFLSDQQKLELQNQLSIMDNLLGQAGLQQGAYQFDQSNQYRNSPLGF